MQSQNRSGGALSLRTIYERLVSITREDLLGYSLGVAVSLAIAIRHPDLVGKFMLASTSTVSRGLALDRPGTVHRLLVQPSPSKSFSIAWTSCTKRPSSQLA